MGWHIEINSLLRLGKDDLSIDQLEIGKIFTIKKSNIRLYSIDIPILLLSEDWTVIGYCVVREVNMAGTNMTIKVEVISIFSKEESEIHTNQLNKALKYTNYLK